MMRTKLTLVAASLAALMMSTAHAAPTPATADLSISAKVMPSACNFNIGDGGTWDYGDIPFASLYPDRETELRPQLAKPVSLQCNAPTLVKIKTIDNRLGTATDAYSSSFGLGQDGSGNKIGRTAFGLVDAVIDGVPGYVIANRSNDNDRGWIASNVWSIETGEFYYSFATNWPGPWVPQAATNITWKIQNSAIIVPSDTLDGTRAITLDGSATMELIYI